MVILLVLWKLITFTSSMNDEKKIHIKQERREEALAEICVTVESKKIEAIRQKLEVQEDLDELDELAELETKLFRFIVA